jgi:hypothetical protein
MRAGEMADRVGGGQAGLAHGVAAANNDRVELQVQLTGQIERHPFGPPRIPHDLILPDQRQYRRDNHAVTPDGRQPYSAYPVA